MEGQLPRLMVLFAIWELSGMHQTLGVAHPMVCTVLRPVCPLTVGARSDHWRSAVAVECAWTRGQRQCIGRWVLRPMGLHQHVRCPYFRCSECPTASLAFGAINRSGGRPWLVLGTLGT
jgi:hypothetical protein